MVLQRTIFFTSRDLGYLRSKSVNKSNFKNLNSLLDMAAAAAPVAADIHVVAVMPSAADSTPSDLVPVVRAMEEARFFQEKGKADELFEVNAFADKELGGAEVVELIGKGVQVSFKCRCSLPYLVMHARDIGKFCEIGIEVVDTTGRVRTLTATTKSSLVRIKGGDTAQLPMVLEAGKWNLVVLDLDDLTKRAFGAEYQCCRKIVAKSDMRISKIFFQDLMYEDRQLPEFLRVIK